MKGYVSKIETFATLDGQGVRYQIFFQGCPLRCLYCHNPETWKVGEHKQEFTVKALINNIENYKEYFGDDGGVTLCGGEPLMQNKFVLKLMKALKKKKINVVLDTSGYAISKTITKIIKLCDVTILDLKFATQQDYKKYAEGSLDTTLKFLDLLQKCNCNVWLRTVVVPKINDTKKQVAQYVDIVKKYNCVSKYVLLAFHTMGFSKYQDLNIDNPAKDILPTTEKKKNELQKYVDDLLSNGVK